MTETPCDFRQNPTPKSATVFRVGKTTVFSAKKRADSLTRWTFRTYMNSYHPWRFGAKVRGGPSGPPLLFPAHVIVSTGALRREAE